MDKQSKRFAIFAVSVIALVVILALVNLYQAKQAEPPVMEIAYSQFLDDVAQSHVQSVVIAGHQLSGKLADGKRFKTYAADDPNLVSALRQADIDITAVAPSGGLGGLASLVKIWLPLLLVLVLAIYFMNRMSRPGGRARDLGKAKARRLPEEGHHITFGDVAGVDEAREDLQEIVDFLRHPQQFRQLGGCIPRGVLLVGPPGTGKTLLARAIAGEAKVPFFTISGSDFVEMFVGIGAARVRDMFEQAKAHAPCIIFMDEIDAVGRRRGAGLGGGNDEREQTLNQLLVEMDGFVANESVILIAATNRPDVLDPALLRPGRFDREIVVTHPDIVGREQILAIHSRHVPLGPDVDLELVARSSPGFSGAELMNLVNEAALLAARRRKAAVGMLEFEDARDKVTMGAEHRSQAMTESEKRLTAYREGGRAIVAMHTPAADPVHKVTIIPRGRTFGTVNQIPEHDQFAPNLEQMTARLTVMMAGRVAEETVFGRKKVSCATGQDIESATKLARDMVTRWGLSEALGAVAYGENQDEVFLGHSVARQHTVSEKTAQIIAIEIRKLIDAGLDEARRVIGAHREELDLLAGKLLVHETLSGDEIHQLLDGLPNQQPDQQVMKEPPEAATRPAAASVRLMK